MYSVLGEHEAQSGGAASSGFSDRRGKGGCGRLKTVEFRTAENRIKRNLKYA